MKSNIYPIVQNRKCTGCAACANACPAGAIQILPNAEGFFAPRIDKKACTHCGLCTQVCPVCRPAYDHSPAPACYAVMGDDRLRMQSSSGGVFTMLARRVLKEGGAVCGAAYTRDWGVEHVIVEDEKDLDKLRKSKYMQSNTAHIYRPIKNLLEQGRKVLFAGCPCQVAGLRSFLGKNPDGLLTIDVVCHGAPSPAVFQKFLQENKPGKTVKNIDFREKEVWGWQSLTVIKYHDGEIYRKPHDGCPFFRGFLANLFLNAPCGNCPFNKIPRQGDVTLGDFWEIHRYNPLYTDGKGTGIVLANSAKGAAAVEQIRSECKLFEPVPMDFALQSNPNLNNSFKTHPNRDLFFTYLQNHSYRQAFSYAMGEKYDIAVFGLGFIDNYGAALTNFGLIKTLENMGKTVLMIDRPKNFFHPGKPQGAVKKFNQKYFALSAEMNDAELPELNDKADAFLVGSDQVWHWNVLKTNSKYALLEFVLESKKKIAYASSFGHDELTAPALSKYMISYLLSRFDAVSVRESSGVEICKDLAIEAQHVLDPVFLCDTAEYIRLASSAKPKKNPGQYVFSYILDPQTGDKAGMLRRVEKTLGLPLVIVNDLDASAREGSLPMPTEQNLSVEEFLSNLYHSRCVVTDSFHGVCFSILFRKNFVCIANKRRGVTRFESLLGRLGLESRMFYSPEDFTGREELLSKDIDYDKVYSVINAQKESSFRWLTQMLNKPPKSKTPSFFDYQNLKRCLESNDSAKHILWTYYRYKVLSKITFGKKRKNYKAKREAFHHLVREWRKNNK